MTNFSRLFWIILWTTMTFPAFLTAQTIPLLSQSELDPYGFKRVWFHQLQLHPAQGKIQNTLLEGGQLFITTNDAKLHVLDSETGKWLWSRSVGDKSIPLTEPSVNSRVVAVHNNMTVFLFNRKTGKQLLQIPLPEAAAAACEMSEHYLYVPMVNQTFLVYVLREALVSQLDPGPEPPNLTPVGAAADPNLAKIIQDFEEAKRLLRAAEPEKEVIDDFVLDNTHRIPITGTAFGTLRAKPLLLQQFYSWVLDEQEEPTHEVDAKTHIEFISWVTEQGFLYAARIKELSDKNMTMLYRVDSAGQTFFMDWTRTIQVDRPGNKAIVARPTQSQIYPVNEMNPDRILVPDVVVTGGRAQYVFAIDAQTGNVRWQYPAKGQLLEPIAVIGTDVYAPTSNGGLHTIDLKTGKERWYIENVKRFVAASRARIYVLDQRKRLVCLDRATGASVFTYDIHRFDHCLFNLETDQIFLLTDKGLIQCLREKQFDSETENGTSLRHRISSEELAAVIKGKDMPRLWWVKEVEEEPEEQTTVPPTDIPANED